MENIGIIVSLAAAAVAISYIIYQRAFSPLAGVPGPFAASLSRVWLTQLSWRGGTHKVMIELHRRHGPLVRIAPNELSVADPHAIKTIYGHGTKFRKSDWYSVWQGHRKFDLFPERDEKLHGRQRALVSRIYSMEALGNLEGYVNSTLQAFMQRMDDFRKRGESVDMGSWVQFFAFDIIGEITFSKRFGFLDIPDAYPAQPKEFEQIETALRSAAWIGQQPWLYWLHDSLMPWIGNHLGITARHGSLRSFAVAQVEERRQRGSDHDDVLRQLLQKHEARPDELDLTAVQSMATSNIFAGSDTTAASTRATIDYLLRSPASLAKLTAEIDSFKKQGKLSDPVRLHEALDMPYLQAVLYESLRMHPAVGMSLPRVVPDDGFEIRGRYLPKGTVVGTNPWVLHRDRSVFGDDADVFNPDRWLDKEKAADMHRFFFSFGSGARTCLGKNISWMEMSMLIPTLFDKYTLALTNPEKELTMNSWWFVMQKGLHVSLESRKTSV